MKCEKCGYSLQIEDEVCPSCGTENAFGRSHREEMERYSQEFQDTQDSVINSTKKTAGVMVRFIIGLVLIILSVIIFILSAGSGIRESGKIRKVRNNIDQYRNEYVELEKSNDYVLLHKWFVANNLNKVPEFKDCLNVFNVCMYYEYLVSYAAEITYEDYMENTFRDRENYCESIISSYDQMLYYAQLEENSGNDNAGHTDCINSCIAQARVIIQSVFKLTDEQMDGFDDKYANERIVILMENWPYEE